jgi:hypothetical protein
MTTPQPAVERSYGCSFACGNPYDFILITVADATTLFLCLPCYVRAAHDAVMAVTESESPEVQKALADEPNGTQVPMTGTPVKERGRNAPVEEDDEDVIEEFDRVITVDQLPPEFL